MEREDRWWGQTGFYLEHGAEALSRGRYFLPTPAFLLTLVRTLPPPFS